MLTIVCNRTYGDWVAVYRNGNLIQQGHSVDWRDLLDNLDIKYTVMYIAAASINKLFKKVVAIIAVMVYCR